MNSKTLVLVVAALVAVVAVSAFVLYDNNSGDDSKDFDVTYHGNGGSVGPVDTSKSPNTSVAECNFANGDLHFYKWNTKADGTGLYFSPYIDEDDDRLHSSGAKDLYAIWCYYLDVEFRSSVVEGTLTPGLQIAFPDAPSVPVQNINSSVFLDPDSSRAIITLTNPYEGEAWVSGPDNSFTAQAAGHYLCVSFSGFTGFTEPVFAQDVPGKVTMSFSYESNAGIAISVISSESNVAYHGNGGLTKDGKDTVVTYDPQVLSPRAFVKEGVEFKEWNTKADGTGTRILFDEESYELICQNNITDLYAIWGYTLMVENRIIQVEGINAPSLSVQFPGKSVPAVPFRSMYLYSDCTEFVITVVSPYTEDGWFSDTGAALADDGSYTIYCDSDDHYLSVSFSKLNGLTISSVVINNNEAAITFQYTGEASMSTVVESSEILVAYHGNGGTTLDGSVTVMSSDTKVLGYGSFGKPGYAIDYWTENADGTGKIIKIGEYQTIVDNRLADLYAHWAPVAQ